jgi:amino acid adenylation domain-containing protein
MSDTQTLLDDCPTAVAVIGMAGRFPGAPDLDAFWRNLADGVESIRFFSPEELREAGWSPELTGRPDFVPARGALEGIDRFDAAFFGIPPREAELMDPQQRLFLECAWEALEDAGCDPGGYEGSIGLYAGVSQSAYARLLAGRPDVDGFQAGMNDKDFLATRASFRLNLRGPSVVVQTACSTSLVAVHLACQALVGAECDVALAGGSSVGVPQVGGYVHQEGGIASPDGHCRAFDARARGTVGGSGVGVVVLKRLEDALRDGDPVRAVIRGSALNNDGALKAGYTAPSADGQARVIAEALSVAGVPPETVSYVEAHGTATEIGDPTEVAALVRAMGDRPAGAPRCALGSVKTNVGHLDAAAGVAGLVKTVLALEHRQLPPSLHFREPNPGLELEGTSFYVAASLHDWETGGPPRRAGVSSFGIGGTNAHVVLEEAPEPEPSEPARRWQLLALSARTPAALERAAERLRAHLAARPEQPLADVAWTLQAGRRAFPHRRAVVCRSHEEAIAALAPGEAGRAAAGTAPSPAPEVAFLFPGQGAQHVGMARETYREEPVFREQLDRCAEILRPRLGLDLRDVIFPAPGGEAAAAEALEGTALAQPALFAVEYSLARLWESRGVRPAAMLGHSIGEYVAAALAGVFRLEDALALVAARGRLMAEAPAGRMLAVPLPEADARALLGTELSLAAVNGPAACVVSGPAAAVEALRAELAGRGIESRPLRTSRAFHSAMMDPVLERFRAEVARLPLRAPEVPFLSNLSGTWITPEEATDPDYWARHLRGTVRFADGAAELLREPGRVLLEVGPGRTLASLARRQGEAARGRTIAASLPHPAHGGAGEGETLAAALGALWCAGVEVDWPGLHAGERRRRVSLPTYPFERRRFWIEPLNTAPAAAPREDTTPIPGPSMTVRHHAPADRPARRERIAAALTDTFARLLGVGAADVAPGTAFLELGVDSLLLLQASRALEEGFGVKVPFRAFMEELSTVDALAAHLDAELPADAFPAPAEEVPPPPTAASPAVVPNDALPSVEGSAAGSVLERVMAEQMRTMSELMARQLDTLRGAAPVAVVPTDGDGKPSAAVAAAPVRRAAAAVAKEVAQQAFGPHRPVKVEQASGLTERQRRHLDALVARYNARTAESKRMAAEHRPHLADNRASAGFKLLWKELVYPLVGARSEGSRLWDADGNEYVDFTMGFGVHLFGHSPPFVTDALRRQLETGLHLGPQSDLAGEVAEAFCRVSGMERATFCNTGSEAVMTALRVARTVTGRSRVVMFAGSYHGAFDGVLARPREVDGAMTSVPVALGITPGMVEDVLVLEYGSDAALETLRALGPELAAVLVEPVQSRRPDFQPRDFLHELRRITAESGTALVFDEIISGFRLHPQGAQGLFGVRADLATYGKVLGGGLPVGVVAGSAAYMDAIDGGAWSYGDASYPQAIQTFFAGTFSRNPLVMAAAAATLRHLERSGPALQEELTRRTTEIAGRLNAVFAREEVPVRVVHGGSLFRFAFRMEDRDLDLLFFHMLERGIYVWEGRGCFLSTAHTDDDLDRLVRAVEESIADLRAGGFLPERGADVNDEPAEELSVPATPAQRQVWVHAQLGDDASRAYNETLPLRFRGALDAAALGRALQRLVDRHEALRSSFPEGGDTVRVRARVEAALPVSDLSAAPDPKAAAAALLADEARRPFDLAAGPLFRARLARLAADDHLFVLVVHHVAADGFSMGILLRELRALLDAEGRGEAARLPRAPRWSDHALQLAERRGSAAMAEAAAYWRAQLAGAVALELPSARAASPTGEHAGARALAAVDGATLRGLKRLSGRAGGTLFMTLAAGFTALLHRITEQDDVLLGTPSLGRTFAGDEGLVGHCVDLLPLRSRVAGDPRFLEHLAATRRVLLDALRHQDFALGSWAAAEDAPGAGRLPPISVIFNLEPAVPPAAGGAAGRPGAPTVETVELPVGNAKFDLGIDVAERGGELHLNCLYDADRFDAAWMRRLLDRFARLLAHAAEEPEARLSDLPLLLAEEREHLAAQWSAARAFDLPAATLHERFAAQARRTPDAVAVTDAAGSLTYAGLDARAGALAARLRALGVGPETRVGVLAERSVELVAALLGVLRAGGAYVPLDPAYPADRVAFMLADSGARVLVAQERLAARLPEFGGTVVWVEAATDPLAPSPPGPLSPASGRKGEHDIAQGEDALSHSRTFALSHSQLAYVIYTSGSTGTPKGVQVTHGNVLRLFAATEEWFGFGAEDVWTLFHSYAFDFSVWEMWGALLHGGRLVVVPADTGRDPAAFRALLAREGVTVLSQTPSAFRQLVAADAEADGELALRWVVFGGEALEPGTLRPWTERHGFDAPRLVNMYGITETTVHVTFRQVAAGDVEAGRGSPVGVAIPDLRVYVLDRAANPAPEGVPGEMYVGGAGVARGYLGRPGLTAERFVPDPFAGAAGARMYRSGDRARWSADGGLEYLGRADEQLKVRGFRIEPGEVEAAVLAGGGVREAVVVAREDAPGDRRLVAYLVPAAEGAADAAELRRALHGRLPDHMVPSAFVWLPALPLTANGKLDRRALPAPEGADGGREYVAPRTALETVLAGVWAETLRVERVGVHDSFFDLGGHSLLATQVSTRLKSYRLEVPVRSIFLHPTVEALAAAVAADEANPGQAEKLASLIVRLQSIAPDARREMLAGRQASAAGGEA